MTETGVWLLPNGDVVIRDAGVDKGKVREVVWIDEHFAPPDDATPLVPASEPQPIEVRTEVERDPGPCPSVSPDGRYRCRYDDGHKPRHEAWTGTSLLRWNDQEAARG